MAKEASVMTVTNDELNSALEMCQDNGSERPLGLGASNLHKLLKLIVARLEETSDVFNEHTHPVHSVCTEGDEYRSAGSGHTDSPGSDSGFGGTKPTQIGVKPFGRLGQQE